MKTFNLPFIAFFMLVFFACGGNSGTSVTEVADSMTETALSTLEKNAGNKRLVIREEHLTVRFAYTNPGNDTAKTTVGLTLSGNDSLHVPVGTFPGKGITLKELDVPEMPKGSFIGSQVMDFAKGNGEEFVAYRCSDSTVRISKRHIEKNIPTEKFKVVKEVIVSPKTKIKADIGYKSYL